jgi:pyridoxamine 5'-phosphate oxidase
VSETTTEFTPLLEHEADPNPFGQFERWFSRALNAGLKLPEAMTLATATKDGKPSARMVLLKGYDESGFVFYTNYNSRKGDELAENPHAALVFYWAPLGRQIRIEGTVAKVSRQESEAYFRSRPLDSRLGAWASNQSEVITGREVLERRLSELEEEYKSGDVPLPPYWGGYRLSPESIEFWQNRAGRLHDRIRYRRTGGNQWLMERLAP